MRAALLAALAACSAAAAPSATPVAAPTPRFTPTPLMSAPGEYDIARISREAGKAIFARTGIGDPYRTGVPYPIFLALLRAFPKTLGATTDELAHRFGFVSRAADPASADLDVREGLPLGMHLTTDPITNVPFVVTNCALCHAERLRWPGGEATVIGLGNKRVRIHAYDAAFAQITREPGFSAERLGRLASEAAGEHHVAWPDAYRDAIVGATIASLRQRAADRAELHARVAGGPPGRVATIESFALVLAQLTGKPVDYAPTVGWAKVPDVIGFAQRTTLSWDGSGQGPMDLLAVEADVAAGVRVEWMQHHPFQGASLGAYLRQPEPRPAFPGTIDRALAERGRALFDQHCAQCHGHYGNGRALEGSGSSAPSDAERRGVVIDYDEQVVSLEEVGTDPARAQAATASFERAANDPALTLGYTKFVRTDGYVPPVLVDVWARAPYGHAGQWPSLAVLATPPERRARQVVLALDAPYDLGAVGVATRAPGAALGAGEYLQDAARPGLSNAGHPFLADLGDGAAAVIEYLKTL
ncbi:MAG TPA: hypothetical protein VMJ10_26480 [Kofleriaceae bacterium]|nr:hypothetical protein [Kofleriaceae bacterium]